MIDTRIQGVGMTSRRTRERLITRLRDEGIQNAAVLDAIRNVPRHLFVDEALAHRAYEDTALPIGYSQTISQPYVVARMTELILQHGVPQRVLEIGAGSGYQTAILSRVSTQVFSVERIEPLLTKAQQRMAMLGIDNVHMKYADGAMGWSDQGPFNAILSAAAPYEVPRELLQQLAPGGVMVIPVGDDESQALRLITRTADGAHFDMEEVEAVRFVPLLSGVRSQ